MFVEFVKNERHRIHQRVHIRWSIVSSYRATIHEGCLERFEIPHPFEGESVRENVRFVEDENER